jgi:hypothetical protein
MKMSPAQNRSTFQIINENITDSQQRRQALSEIDQQLLWKQISENKFDEARQLMAHLRTKWDRINLLTQMASSALNAGKKEMAAQFLDEAWAMVDGPVESSQQFHAQLQIAGIYLKLKPARSFEILEGSLDQFNELFAATAFIENFEPHGSFREKEMILRAGGRASSYLQQYAQHLSALAPHDPDRVRQFIGRFARAEVRANLQLAIVQQILRRTHPMGGYVSSGIIRSYQSLH